MLKKILILMFLLLFTGCQEVLPPLPANPTSTDVMLPQPTIAHTPVPTLVPTLAPCKSITGTIAQIEIPTKKLKAPITANVYLPPCYDPESRAEYPVLYMLHGQTYGVDQWIRLGLTDTADRLISEKTIQPLIIIMPFDANWRTVPPEATFGDALIVEVLPFIENHYAACSMRECRAIGGLSRGGNWAVYLGFSHPDLFAAVGAHSAPLFFGEMGRITASLEQMTSVSQAPVLFIDIGSKDTNKQEVLDFVSTLKNIGVSYEFFQFIGRHEESYWSAHVSDYLTWYSSQIGAVTAASQPTPGK